MRERKKERKKERERRNFLEIGVKNTRPSCLFFVLSVQTVISRSPKLPHGMKEVKMVCCVRSVLSIEVKVVK